MAVSLIRKHGQFLGFVEAADKEAAEAAAVARFNLSEEQRGRLVIQKQDRFFIPVGFNVTALCRAFDDA